MRNTVLCCVFSIMLSLAGVASFAKMTVPGRTASWVNDYAGIIEEKTEAYIEQRICDIEQKTPDPIEVIIATFSSIEGWDFKDFAVAYGEKWREVKRGKRDNGVILLVVLDGNHAAIGPGQNLKNVFNNVVINDILRNKIIPDFTQGNYSDGIKKGADAILSILKDSEIPADNPVPYRVLVVGLLIVAALIGGKRLLKRT